MHVGVELSLDGRRLIWRPVDKPILTVGREPSCDLCVPHEAVAPLQALLCLDGQQLTLVNKSSTGTWVDGTCVLGAVEVTHASQITLGAMRAVVRQAPEVVAVAAGRQTAAMPGGRYREEVPVVGVVVAGAKPDKLWLLGAAGLAVGSDARNDVVLQDPYVSGFHASFTQENGRCVVRDLGSRNGVFVGGLKVREAQVPMGAQVLLGQTVLLVVAAPSSAAAAQGHEELGSAQLVGSSAVMQRLRASLVRLAAANAPVLITGETGCGKEVVARLLVQAGGRAKQPFVALNCGALGRHVVESELFGHEKGAFTGAVAAKAGAFEAADGGTIFLDEIGELPWDMQPLLLRVLETGEVRRVGSNHSFQVDVRVLAATNRRLAQEVARGEFREDLFHRLHVLVLELPPLRERLEDIEELTHHFLADFAPLGEVLTCSEAAMDKLRHYAWPGNVRQLRNVLQRAALLRSGACIEAEDISLSVGGPLTPGAAAEAPLSAQQRLSELERGAIRAALAHCHGNKSAAAQFLGVHRSTLHRKLEELD